MKWPLTRYRIVPSPGNDNYRIVQRKKWHNLRWKRCKGLESDLFRNLEDAKAAIPLYDKGASYWMGTMVDLTKERVGVKSDG